MSRKIISAIVENKPGVLFRITNMIRRRSFNIDSITVGTMDHKEVSRITMSIDADEATLEQLVKQLFKLIDVLEVKAYNEEEVTLRELALIQVDPATKVRMDLQGLKNFRIIDSSPSSLTMELVGSPQEIDEFLKSIDGSGLIAVARTGLTALPKR